MIIKYVTENELQRLCSYFVMLRRTLLLLFFSFWGPISEKTMETEKEEKKEE